MGYPLGLVVCKNLVLLVTNRKAGWERFLLGIRLLAFGYILESLIYLKQPLKPINLGTMGKHLLETYKS